MSSQRPPMYRSTPFRSRRARMPDEPLGRHERGERARLVLADLHQQPPARLRAPRGAPATMRRSSAEAVRAAVQRQRAARTRDLRRQRRISALGRYGGFATTRSSARASEPSGARRSPASEPDPLGEPERAHVAETRRRARRGERRRPAPRRRAARPRARRRWRRCRFRGRRSPRSGQPASDLERPFHEPLGLRPRHQHVGGDGQAQAVEILAAQQVLERLAGARGARSAAR